LYKYLIGENEGEGDRLLSVVPSDRTRGSRCKFKILKIYQNTRNSVILEKQPYSPRKGIENLSYTSWCFLIIPLEIQFNPK